MLLVVLLSIIAFNTHPTASRTCIGGGTWVYRQRIGKKPDCPSALINGNGYQWGTVADCKSSCESHPTCNVIVRFGSGGVNDNWLHHCYAHSCPDIDNISWLDEDRWGVEKNSATQWILTQCITGSPSQSPSALPTSEPSANPTLPTYNPSTIPTINPTEYPTTNYPSNMPSVIPTEYPSQMPSVEPSEDPTGSPTQRPSRTPSRDPTFDTTEAPTSDPIEEGEVMDEMTTTKVAREYAVGDMVMEGDPLFVVYIVGAVTIAFILGIIFAFICCTKRKKTEMVIPGANTNNVMEKHDKDTAVYVGSIDRETQGIHDAVDDGKEDDMVQSIDNLGVLTGDHGDVIVVNDEFNVETKGNYTASDNSDSFNVHVQATNTKTGSPENDEHITVATADNIPYGHKMRSLDVDDIAIDDISNVHVIYKQSS